MTSIFPLIPWQHSWFLISITITQCYPYVDNVKKICIDRHNHKSLAMHDNNTTKYIKKIKLIGASSLTTDTPIIKGNPWPWPSSKTTTRVRRNAIILYGTVGRSSVLPHHSVERKYISPHFQLDLSKENYWYLLTFIAGDEVVWIS